MSKEPPFNPEEFAKWLVEGVRETLQYRFQQSIAPLLDPEQLKVQILELIKKKIPTRNQVFHRALRRTFEKNGFEFELIQQGDALFHIIRKRIRPTGNRRLLLIPGLGDTPSSWIPPFAFLKNTLEENFDELLMIDFPGYLGFLSHTQMVPSMTLLQNVVQMVVDSNAPTVVIGHSLGGWLAAKAAQKTKKPLDHLILVAPSGLTPVAEREAFGDFILKMQSVPFEVLIEKLVHETKPYHQFLKQEFNFFYSKPELKQFIESVKPHEFIQENESFMTKKLSILWGEDDVFVPSHWMRHWVECYGPYVDAYTLKKVGHLPQLERPKALADWLKLVLTGQCSRSNQGDSAPWRSIHQATRSFITEALPGAEAGKTHLLQSKN